MIEGSEQAEDKLIPVFSPALIVLLVNAEREKRNNLTKEEVLGIRDNGTCIMLPASIVRGLDEKRGYEDIDPERCWEHWQECKGCSAER